VGVSVEERFRFLIAYVGDHLVHVTIKQTIMDQFVQQVAMASCQELEPAPLVRFEADT